MLGLRFTTEAHARSKKGQPAQKTVGVARTRPIQFTTEPYPINSPVPPNMPAMVTMKTGAVRTAAMRSRLVMSTSSGLGASSNETTRGSRAIPQIGHAPGASRTISGCIGQVYSVLVRAAGFDRSGSSAMPHAGHAPGCDDRTSGSIGQMNVAPAGGGAGAAVAGSRNGFGSARNRSRQLG